MAIPKKILNYLEKSGVKYDVLEHRKIYTALDKSRTLKTKESLVGKTVVLKFNNFYGIALLGSDKIIDLEKITKKASIFFDKEIKKTSFAKEAWIKENLKGMKEGVLPPFGDIWNIPVFIDKSFLEKNNNVVVNSGDQKKSFKITSSALKKIIANPIIGVFSKQKTISKKKLSPVKKKKTKKILTKKIVKKKKN